MHKHLPSRRGALAAAPVSQAPDDQAAAGPVSPAERVAELDVLRGVALFGVFLMNLVGFAGNGIMATRGQLAALPTAELDHVARFAAEWLVADKANTIFAFLFGLGFYIQGERAAARGAAFERIYLRRLTLLLLFGIAHLLLIWTWDILHLYALAGFLLFALRRLSSRALLALGLALALLARIVQEGLAEYTSLGGWHGWPSFYTDEAVLARQAEAASGDYPALVQTFAVYTWADYLLNGLLIAWLLYALGRFLIGGWVGRHGWLQEARDHLPGFRRVMVWTLPMGLILAGLGTAMVDRETRGLLGEWEHWYIVGSSVKLLAAPLLATGYVCAIVVALHTPFGRRLLRPFRHVGRMALTNYVAQSFVIGIVLFGVGPGLALGGRIGTTVVWVIVIFGFGVQMLVSRYWLSFFSYGPLEWVWRGLTYGAWPPLRRPRALAARA